MAQQKVAKQVLVLFTYRIKRDYAPKGLHRGDVVLVVRNGEDVNYTVTLRRNGVHSCTCPAGVHNRECYHLTSSKAQFNARVEARRTVKSSLTVAQTVVVATPVAIEEYRMNDAVYAKLKATAKPAQEVVEMAQCKQQWDQGKRCLIFDDEAMLNAALTRNKAFSIL